MQMSTEIDFTIDYRIVHTIINGFTDLCHNDLLRVECSDYINLICLIQWKKSTITLPSLKLVLNYRKINNKIF